MKFGARLLVITALVASLSSCEDKPAPPSRVASQPEAPKPAAAIQKPEVPNLFTLPKNDYTYNPAGKRDPFKAYAGEVVESRPEDPRTPLEQFELDQFALTAIVWGISEPRGLLRAPDGQSYIIRKDMRLGKNRGRVSRITRREILVEEEYRDPTGKLVVRESSIAIRQKEKEKGAPIPGLKFQDEE